MAEKSKEFGTKGWSFLKAGYANMASHVEHMARENGYNVDLGESFRFAVQCMYTSPVFLCAFLSLR